MKLTKKTTVLYMDAETTTWNEYIKDSNKNGRKASVKRFLFNPSSIYDNYGLKTVQRAENATQALLALDELSTRNRFAPVVVFAHDLKFPAAFLRAEARKSNPKAYTFSEYMAVSNVLRNLSSLNVTRQQLFTEAGIKSITYKLNRAKDLITLQEIVYDGKVVILDVNGFIEIARDFSNAWIDLVDSTGNLYMSKYISSCFSAIDFRDSRKLYDTSMDDIFTRAFADLNWDDYCDAVNKDPLECDTDALKILMDKFLKSKGGDLKLTRSAYTYAELKKTIKNFNELFPPINISYWEEIQPAYFGGIVYRAKPEVKYLDVKKGYSLDVNSEYPAVMAKGLYPCGAPTLYLGDYKNHVSDENTKHVFLQVFRAKFKKKKDTEDRVYVPCLPRSLSVNGGPVMSSSSVIAYKRDIILTDVDLRLFFDNYDVSEYEPIYYYCFNAIESPFSGYILKHYEAKKKATEEMIKAKSEGLPIGVYESIRLESKLTLNSAYGKFAERPLKESMVLETDIFGRADSKLMGFSRNPGNYLPVAIWVTAYAREVLLDGVARAGGSFVYCDTDSIHAVGEIPDSFKDKIDPYELGAWKLENVFTAARFVREKCYAEQIETEDGPKIIAKVAGLSEESKEKNITKLEDLVYSYENGKKYDLNVTTSYVAGGIIKDTNASKELKPNSRSSWNQLTQGDRFNIIAYIESARKHKFNRSDVKLTKSQSKAIFYLYAMISYRETTSGGISDLEHEVYIKTCEHFVRDIMNEMSEF